MNKALEEACVELEIAGRRARDITPLCVRLGFKARQRIMAGDDPAVVRAEYESEVEKARKEWNG